MLGPVVAQHIDILCARPPCCVTAVRNAWECINANCTGYTVNLAWTRKHRSAHSGSHLYIYISDIMTCRLCVVQCVALRVQWNNSLARNKIMIMEYPSSSLRFPAPAPVHVLHMSVHCRLPWWWASRLHDVGSRLPLPRNLSPAFVV